MSFKPLFPSAKSSILSSSITTEVHEDLKESNEDIPCHEVSESVKVAEGGFEDVSNNGKSKKGKKDLKKIKQHKKRSRKKRHRHEADSNIDEKHTSRHLKRKRVRNDLSDESCDSCHNDDNVEQQIDNVLFLPNGQFIFQHECDSNHMSSGDIKWSIDRSCDHELLQFGTYRLDIPAYEVYQNTITSRKVSSTFPNTQKHQLFSSNNLSENHLKGLGLRLGRTEWKDDNRSSRKSRYFGVSNAWCANVPILRSWLVKANSKVGLKRSCIIDYEKLSVIPLPPPLPEAEVTADAEPPPPSKGISSNTSGAKNDNLTASNLSALLESDVNNASPTKNMKTDRQFFQEYISFLSSKCRFLHNELLIEVDSSQQFSSAYRWFDLAKLSGRLATNQLLFTIKYDSEAKNISLQHVLFSSLEREFEVLKEGLSIFKLNSNLLPLFYQALLYFSKVLRKVTALTNSVYHDKIVPLDSHGLWKQISRHCPLNAQLRLLYTLHQIRQDTSCSNKLSEKLCCESNASYASRYRLLMSREQLLENIMVDMKNKAAANSVMSSCSSVHPSSEIKSNFCDQVRLQEDLDCFKVENFHNMCNLESAGGHTERVYALIQANVEVSLCIYPSALIEMARSSVGMKVKSFHDSSLFKLDNIDDLECFACSQLGEYWDSEFGRLGEVCGDEDEPTSTVEGCFLHWTAAGRPIDGWSHSRCVTGHFPFHIVEGGENLDKDNSVAGNGNCFEPTTEEYLDRVRKVMHEYECKIGCHAMHPKPTDESNERRENPVSNCSSFEENDVVDVVSEWETRKLQSFPAQLQGSQMSIKGSGESPDVLLNKSDESDSHDEYIYSAVHGYRIKVPQAKKSEENEENLETKAYKKILGDMKDEDFSQVSAEAILKRYQMPLGKQPQLKTLSDRSQFKLFRSKEAVLSLLQWRPLRINASVDAASSMSQPDRVLLKEDLTSHLFIARSRVGREMLIARSLALLGVNPSCILHGMTTPSSSSFSDSCADPSQFMSNYWVGVIDRLSNHDSDSQNDIFSVLDRILNENFENYGRRSHDKSRMSKLDELSELSIDPLLALNMDCGDFSGPSADALHVMDVVRSILSRTLVQRHLACSLMRLASPLTLLIKFIRQILKLNYFVESECEKITLPNGRCHAILTEFLSLQSSKIMSSSFCVKLKRTLLMVLHAKYLLDKKLDTFNVQIGHGCISRDNSFIKSKSLSDEFEVQCRRILLEEEQNISASFGNDVNCHLQQFEVWNSYAQSEITLGNATKARKVCRQSLLALCGAAQSNRIAKDNIDYILEYKRKKSAIDKSFGEEFRRELVDIFSKSIDRDGPTGVSALIEVDKEVDSYSHMMRLCWSNISGGFELYQLSLHLILNPVCSSMLCQIKLKDLSKDVGTPAENKSLTLEEKRDAVDGALLLLLQLSKGGALDDSVRSSDLTNVLKGKKIKRRKNSLINDLVIVANISELDIAVATCKLSAMVRGLWILLEKLIIEERMLQADEDEMGQTRLQSATKPVYSSVASSHFSDFVRAVNLLAWWHFLSSQYCKEQWDASTTVLDCTNRALVIFDNWITEILELLDCESFFENISDSTISTSRSPFFKNLTESSFTRGHGRRLSVFDVMQSKSGKSGGLWQSSEEQGLLFCLERLYIERVRFSLICLVQWDYSFSACGKNHLNYENKNRLQHREIIRRLTVQGLFDFPLNRSLNHVLLCVDLLGKGVRLDGYSLSPVAGSKIALKQYISDASKRLGMWGFEFVAHYFQLCIIVTECLASTGDESELVQMINNVNDIQYGLQPFNSVHWSEDATSSLLTFLDSLLLPHFPGSGDELLDKNIVSETPHSLERLKQRCCLLLTARSDFQLSQHDSDFNSHQLINNLYSHQYVHFWQLYLQCIYSELLRSNKNSAFTNSFFRMKARGKNFELSMKRRLLQLFSSSRGGKPLTSLCGNDLSAINGCLPRKCIWLHDGALIDLVYSQQQLMQGNDGDDDLIGRNKREEALFVESKQKMNEFGIILRSDS